MKFWMVYVEGNRGAEYKHESQMKARVEASRLATINPGKKVYVLEAIADVAVSALNWQDYPVEEIPF